MRDPNRLEQLAREANAYTKEPLPPVERVRRDSIATTPVDQADARESLISQRTGSVYYRDPAKQKRNILRSKKDKAALANTDNWSYTKAERYAVLDQQIRKGGPAGLAQAVLAFDPTDRLDVDVGYVANENGDAICTNKPNGWLDLVAGRNGRNDVAYIRLLTSFGASNASRDKALKVALDHGAMETAQELLRNDADPNSAGVAGHFLAAIRDLNQYLYTMFLTATKPLNAFYINQALVEAVSRDSDLVALLIAHGADGLLDDGQALRAAIKERNLQEAAMILINPESDNSLFETSLNIATNVACAIQDEKTKVKFLDILFSAGADPNTPSVQDELLEAVLKHQMSLLKLFIYHGTSPDRNDAEGLRLAVISGQTELVEILLEGAVPETSTSRALDEANGLEDTDIYEEIVKALIEKGVSQTSLSKCLANAVDKGSSSLAPLLIEKGATLDYDNARCVRTALKRHDFSLFGTLLEGSCQPSILAQAIPDAMKIQPSSERLDIMTRLLAKGVSGKELDIALQTVAGSAREQTDYSLIETLMRFNASVDFRDENGNCVYNAAKAQDERVLDLLSQGDPSPDTVSVAIGLLPVSFATAEAVEYERQVGMMTTLLEKGARGTTVAELLITAARDDHREKALRALIHYGADANYQYGRALEEALKLPRISALEIICTGCRIERDSFVAQLPNSLKPDGFSLEKATFFAHASTSYGYTGIFDQPLLDEVGKNGNRREVIELLLSLGASVNFENGRALQHAVSAGNVEVCRLLVAGVKHSNISRAFPATSEITDKPIRYQLMKVLLEAGGLGIGQDEALVQASREATPDDLSHVELLLEHQASADFNKGEAVLQSIQTKNLPLLKRLIRTKLNEKTLAKAFNLAREPGYTTDERYNMFEALLEVYSDDKEVSKALIEAVLRDHNDIKTASLLLDHGASLESQDGLAMQVVAAGGSLELLNLFLSKQPGQKFRSASFRATMDSGLNAKQRIPIYQSLLETGITQDLISAALLQAAQAKIPDQSLLNLLIDFDASLDYDAGSALFGITTRGDLSTLEVLLRGNVSQRQTLDRSFSAAMELAGANRLTIAMALLKKEPGVSRGTISQHLAQIVQQIDYDLLGLMMDYQPDPALNGGESLILAARAGDVTAARILTRVEIPSDTINRAFERLLDSRAIQSNLDGLETARTLLSLGITQQLVDRALLDGFDGAINQLTKDLVELLIPYRPNVSGGEGKIFVDTANSKEVELFRRLASENPDLNIVIPALIRSLLNEEELISWLVHLEECAQRGSTSLQDFVIFTALAQFPQGNQLVTHLLNHGCRANSKTDFELSRPSGIENMTILIWALNHRNISEEVIMGILEKGHEG
jgi:ankyrin repeat protein